jgi:Cft2 family RNA processing exonuclease
MFDPFKGIGLPEPKAKADIVLCSHGHQDHNNTKPVSHEKSVVMEAFTGTRQIRMSQSKEYPYSMTTLKGAREDETPYTSCTSRMWCSVTWET